MFQRKGYIITLNTMYDGGKRILGNVGKNKYFISYIEILYRKITIKKMESIFCARMIKSEP